ncbi:uncharacterized protein [Onthophagus taurus]|uniref:uncharacterized protein isoform X12 n=1 Tax=Onthophagus taurus TaxID=166361 RepID=UPI0039BE6CFF
MYDQDDRIGFLIVFIVLIIFGYGIHTYLKEKKKIADNDNSESSNQDDDVWNISSRVNQQNQDGTPPNWPTHDHRLSMDFVITPEYNIKDTRPPPPPYSELDLPSYEQATGCRPPRADLTPVHQQSDQNRPGPSS